MRGQERLFITDTNTQNQPRLYFSFFPVSLFPARSIIPQDGEMLLAAAKETEDRLGGLHHKFLASYDKKKRMRTSSARFNPRDSAAKMPRDLACWGPRL